MEQYTVQYIDIEKIKPYYKNPRKNDKAVEAVAKSIQEYGWQQVIVVDKDFVIIAGHTRYKAALQLGLNKVPVKVADNLSDGQVRAFRLADNKTGELAEWDNKLLLEELEAIGENLFTGFDFSDIFDDTLDEQDNGVLQENKEGFLYKISFETQDKEKAYKVKKFLENLKNNAE